MLASTCLSREIDRWEPWVILPGWDSPSCLSSICRLLLVGAETPLVIILISSLITSGLKVEWRSGRFLISNHQVLFRGPACTVVNRSNTLSKSTLFYSVLCTPLPKTNPTNFFSPCGQYPQQCPMNHPVEDLALARHAVPAQLGPQ